MLPDPLHHFKHLIGTVGDGHGWIVFGPEEFVLQPELTLLDGTHIATGNSTFRRLHGEVDDPGGGVVNILAVFGVHGDASIAQHFVDGGVDRHAHVADVVGRPTGVQATRTIQQLRRITTGLDAGNRCRLVNPQRGSRHAIDFNRNFAQLAFELSVLGGQTIHLTSDVDAEQAFFFAVLLPHGAQTGEVGGHRLNAPDDGGHFDLFTQGFKGIVSTGYRCRQITKLPRAQIDFATGIGAKISIFAAGGLHGVGALAIEDTGLATTRINHFHELMDE